MAESKRIELIEQSHRVVIKLGTAVLMHKDGLAMSRFYSYVEGIAELMKQGKEVLLVTSGAVGLGKRALKTQASTLPVKQACAAVGQGRLMALYNDAFKNCDITVAQILLTEEDFNNRKRYLNLRTTISELLRLGVLPVINENDTVSTAEIEVGRAEVKVNFGDNDKLSALVASKMDADLLVILTDVDGLYTADPSTPGAELIPLVESWSPEIEALANVEAAADKDGRGGIKTKLAAARIATQSGCAAIIAGGKQDGAISRLARGEVLGTLFMPGKGLSGKQRWIAFATTVKAAITINAGAKDAICNNKSSLLAAGVVALKGTFERGDVISIEYDGREIARGIVNYNAGQVEAALGKHSHALDSAADRNYDAIITRDNLVLL